MPKRLKYPTYQHALAYTREKLEGRKQVAISKALHGRSNKKSYARTLAGDTDVNEGNREIKPELEDPAPPLAPNMAELATMIAANTIAALKGQGRAPKGKGNGKGNGN